MVDADYFDRWYADIARSPARQAFFTTYLGVPPEVGPSNMVPRAGLDRIVDELALEPDDVLVDLACGRGGPGMYVARAAGAQVVGVDFSAEAVRQATERRSLFGLDRRAWFLVGDLTATGVPAGTGHAGLCVDAFGFATDLPQAAAELRRVVRPGGRVALTGWAPRDRSDEQFPERMRRLDLARQLRDAGFDGVTETEMPEWQEPERALWDAVLDAGPSDDPALASLYDEGVRMAHLIPATRRLLVTATAPS